MRIINALKITNKNQIKTKTHYSLGLHFNSFVTCIDSILFRFGTTLMATDSTISRQFNVDQISKDIRIEAFASDAWDHDLIWFGIVLRLWLFVSWHNFSFRNGGVISQLNSLWRNRKMRFYTGWKFKLDSETNFPFN